MCWLLFLSIMTTAASEIITLIARISAVNSRQSIPPPPPNVCRPYPQPSTSPQRMPSPRPPALVLRPLPRPGHVMEAAKLAAAADRVHCVQMKQHHRGRCRSRLPRSTAVAATPRPSDHHRAKHDLQCSTTFRQASVTKSSAGRAKFLIRLRSKFHPTPTLERLRASEGRCHHRVIPTAS